MRDALPGDAEAWVGALGSVVAEDRYLLTDRLTRAVEEFRALFRDAGRSSDL